MAEPPHRKSDSWVCKHGAPADRYCEGCLQVRVAHEYELVKIHKAHALRLYRALAEPIERYNPNGPDYMECRACHGHQPINGNGPYVSLDTAITHAKDCALVCAHCGHVSDHEKEPPPPFNDGARVCGVDDCLCGVLM